MRHDPRIIQRLQAGAVDERHLLEGAATGSADGSSRSLRSGDVMEVPVSSAHVHPHTDASTTAVVEHTIEPRPRFVPVFFASWLTWLGEGKVDRQDEPTLLQVMAIIKEGGGGTWVTGPPVAAQKLLATVLAAVAADAKPAAFRALHQDDADQRDGDEGLNDQQEGEHDGLSKMENERRDLVGAAHPFNRAYLPEVVPAAPLTSASSCSAV